MGHFVVGHPRANMKMLLFMALVAFSMGEPEAKSEAIAEPFYYGGYGLGHGYLGYHGYGYYGKRDAEAEAGYGFGRIGYRGYGGVGRGYYGKREAEAVYHYGGFGYGGHRGFGYHYGK